MACGRARGGAGVGSGPGGAPPKVGVEREVTSTSRPQLPHGLFLEEAHVVDRDHAEWDTLLDLGF